MAGRLSSPYLLIVDETLSLWHRLQRLRVCPQCVVVEELTLHSNFPEKF
jgi:hypothetical protein